MKGDFDPERLLAVLGRHGVQFVVVGGTAAGLHGSPMGTFDLDVAYERSKQNLKRLADALAEIHARLRGIEEVLPFKPDPKTLEMGSNFTFSTDFGPLDCLGWVEGVSSYRSLLEHAVRMELGKIEVLVASIDDLISMKRAAGRPKDQDGVRYLEEIRKMTQGHAVPPRRTEPPVADPPI